MQPMAKIVSVVTLFLWFFANAASGYKLRHKTTFDPEIECSKSGVIDRAECMRVLSHPYLQESSAKLKGMATEVCKSKGGDPVCPYMDEEYLNMPNHTKEGLRSLSPYDFQCEHDSDRIPEYLFQARCLCIHCIDPTTRTSTSTYDSVPIIITINVLKRHKNGPYKLKKDGVQIGCTCVVPE